jgi:flagellar protein FliL
MLRKLIPAILAVAGVAVGGGAGLLLRPTPEPAGTSSPDAAEVPSAHSEADASGHQTGEDASQGALPQHDYVKLNNQFVVPVVENGRVSALVILSLSLEVSVGLSEKVYAIEPKLRDAFLRVMFDHANAGGFRGTFTDGANMVLLRDALREVAIRIMGNDVTDVLIVDIVRQDS